MPEPTDEPGGRYERMSYLDVGEPGGPLWDHYQAARERDHIVDNPDSVPPWFQHQTARNRVAEARVALEFIVPRHRRTGVPGELHAALRVVEQYLDMPDNIEPNMQEHVVAALLGAREEQDRGRRAGGMR